MVDTKLDYLAYPAGKYLIILPFSQKGKINCFEAS